MKCFSPRKDRNESVGTQQDTGADEERFQGCTHVRKEQRQGAVNGGEGQRFQATLEDLVHGRRWGRGNGASQSNKRLV